jgi:hypothetical protein
MRRTRTRRAAGASLLVGALLASTAPAVSAEPAAAQAAPSTQAVQADAAESRRESPQSRTTTVPDLGTLERSPLESTSTLGASPDGKPRNDVIRDVPVDPADASIPLNLIPYHEFPGLLRQLQSSDRVDVEIIGRSTQGRDLHMVVITDMTDAEWTEWQRLSDLRTDDPAAAITAFDAGEYADWRAPIFINNNIHGNEWEGTDAFFEFADELAFSDDPGVVQALEDFLFVGVVSNNPDGRVNATRANAAGFDMNRDWVAQSQPEVRAVRDQILRYDPVSLLDLHGYVGGTLIEPTTGPHGQNYEMDLYIPHALRAAEAMESAIAGLGEPRATTPVTIPYRDWTDDWDGWPAVYTPMWAMQHGAVGHTIEFPLNPRSAALTEAERHDRTRVNTAIARATMEGNLAYLSREREDVVADQLEFFRRGVAGESTRPISDTYSVESAACGSFTNIYDGDAVVSHCNWNTYEQDFPRAWVLPAGDGQRSATAAIRTAQYLLDNDVEVHRASSDVTIGGETYPAGTFVVDMHQAKRGAANNALETGRNLSDDWRAMYGDAAWSVGALYGATLVEVRDGDLSTDGLTEIATAFTQGTVATGADHLGFDVDSIYGVQTVNALQRAGVAVSRLPDGSFTVPGSSRNAVRTIASTYGVDFVALDASRVRDAVRLGTYTIGATTTADQLTALTRMGFDVVPVSTASLNADGGAALFDQLDALFIGAAGFTPSALDEPAATAFDAWLAAGNQVVGQGPSGASFNTNAGLLPVTISAAAGSGDGIATVVNDPDSRVTGDALDVTFVRSPRWFPGAAGVEGVTVDQRLGEGLEYFLAGHWRRYREGAGQPVVVSGEARGATVTLFASDPTARAHTEGLFTQFAEALWPELPARSALAPTADAGNDYTVELGDELTLDGSASISPDGLPLTFTWDVSSLGGTTLEGETVTVTPVEAGDFEVTLTVTDTSDPALSDTDTATVTVVDTTEEPVMTGCEDVEGVTFPDVGGPPHGANIACIAGFGIAQGNASGNYRPFADVRRDQMASFLERLLTVGGVELPAPAAERFPDVPGNSTHKGAIERLAEAGIVEGRASGAYDPLATVTRGQMATFLRRTLEFATGDDLVAPRAPFTDVPARYVHARGIDVTYDLDIARGRTATTFVPNGAVQRDQMGSFLARTIGVMADAGFELTPLD